MLIEQQITERRERAVGAIATILKRPTGEPYGDYSVKSASGKTYRVAMRGPGLFENYCSCPDFRVNTLRGLHTEAVHGGIAGGQSARHAGKRTGGGGDSGGGRRCGHPQSVSQDTGTGGIPCDGSCRWGAGSGRGEEGRGGRGDHRSDHAGERGDRNDCGDPQEPSAGEDRSGLGRVWRQVSGDCVAVGGRRNTREAGVGGDAVRYGAAAVGWELADPQNTVTLGAFCGAGWILRAGWQPAAIYKRRQAGYQPAAGCQPAPQAAPFATVFCEPL